MGAQMFIDYAKGDTAEAAFHALVSQAQYEHGHGGRSGTIAEKSEIVSLQHFLAGDLTPAISECIDIDDVKLMRRIKAVMAYVNAYCLFDDDLCRDKFGPAGYVEVVPGWFVFFGWADSW